MQSNTCLLYTSFCEVTLHTAYEELCKIFGPDRNEKPREYKRRRKIIETAELPIASAEVRDNTYSNLLSLLTLCPTHQASLKERGLTREEIDWLGYRTTPTTVSYTHLDVYKRQDKGENAWKT